MITGFIPAHYPPLRNPALNLFITSPARVLITPSLES